MNFLRTTLITTDRLSSDKLSRMSSQPPEQDGSSPIAGSVQSTTKPERDRESEGSKQSAVQEELMHRPLVDIAVELRRLREENELLRVEKQRLDALLPVSGSLRRLARWFERSTVLIKFDL